MAAKDVFLSLQHSAIKHTHTQTHAQLMFRGVSEQKARGQEDSHAGNHDDIRFWRLTTRDIWPCEVGKRKVTKTGFINL